MPKKGEAVVKRIEIENFWKETLPKNLIYRKI